MFTYRTVWFRPANNLIPMALSSVNAGVYSHTGCASDTLHAAG